MQFLGVGYQEILVVFVLMLLVVGPERMPKVAYQIGKAVRTMQGYARAVRDEFQGEFDYFQAESDLIKGELNVARESLRETGDVLRTEQQRLSADLDGAAKSMEADIEAPAPATKTAGIPTLSDVSSKPSPAETPDETPADAAKPLLF